MAMAPLVVVLAGTTLWPGSARARRYDPPPLDKLFVPDKLFSHEREEMAELDRMVLAANPRVYLYPDYRDGPLQRILVIGMPGWGGRSEKFIWTLINGLKTSGLTDRLVVAAFQDPRTGGPQYQGQGAREHANVWTLKDDTVAATRHLVVRLAREFGSMQVYLMGFSSGGVIAPRLSIKLARLAGNEPYTMRGGIAVGTGSSVRARSLIAQYQRTLFIVVPRKLARDRTPMRDDQHNRRVALAHYKRLAQNGAMAYLRSVRTAKRHVDWHWGLLSQCRYFRFGRIDPGRGYWPNYWMPNPETYSYINAFIRGLPPPESVDGLKPQKCPY
jgi:hypothetical protein